MFDSILILAGGESSRFWPLSDKNLLNFFDKPIIVSQIEKLTTYSKNLVVVVNASNNQSIDTVIKQSGLPVTTVIQEKKGQSSAILSAREKIYGKTLIVNANDIFSESALLSIQKNLVAEIDAAIIVKTVSDYFPGGYVVVKSGVVESIIEKPDPANIPSNQVKLVVDFFSNIGDFISVLGEVTSENDDVYEQALTKYIQNGKKIIPIEYKNEWLTLKYPWHVLDVKDYFLSSVNSGRGKNISVASNAVIKGEVYLDDNVVIHEFVTIVGPVYIGKNTIIGTYSMIRDSIIGADCLIGSYSEVTRSYLGSHVFLHRNYVGDSIFEGNILVGADALTANFRFDQKTIKTPVKGKMIDTMRQKLGAIVGAGSKIGVNSSIMPGVKIESGVIVGPQTKVDRDCHLSK